MNLKWNLDDILKAKDYEKLYKEVEGEIKKLEGWVKKLKPQMSREEFKKMLLESEEMGVKMARLASWPQLINAVDQKNQEAKLRISKNENLGLRIAEVSTKIAHWIEGRREPRLDDKNAKRLFGVIEDLKESLQKSREGAKYSLSEREEKIIRQKDLSGGKVLEELRELIETEFEYRLGGKKIETQAELLALVQSRDGKKRKEAYRQLLEKQKANIDKFFAIYQGLVRDWDLEAKERGYRSPIEVRNWANEVSNKGIESLMAVCREERKVFGDYFKWKAKELGAKKLSRFDVYAPVGKVAEKRVSYEEAKKEVWEALKDFSPKFGKAAQKIIEEKHIDVKPGKNKRGGAFCATVAPSIRPYIMLNFTGRERDITTLAHELGHGIHSELAAGHLPSVQQASLPLAETASTLSELIIFEKMIQKEKDKERVKGLLSQKISDAYASICRQAYFVRFELEAHDKISAGIREKDLSERYLLNLREQFGPAVAIDPLFAYEWSYISHIFESPFYCYAYSFGELLSYALWNKYQKEPKLWRKKIEKILERGGSKGTEKILAEAGIKIEDKNFWREGFETIKGWQQRLEKM